MTAILMIVRGGGALTAMPAMTAILMTVTSIAVRRACDSYTYDCQGGGALTAMTALTTIFMTVTSIAVRRACDNYIYDCQGGL